MISDVEGMISWEAQPILLLHACWGDRLRSALWVFIFTPVYGLWSKDALWFGCFRAIPSDHFMSRKVCEYTCIYIYPNSYNLTWFGDDFVATEATSECNTQLPWRHDGPRASSYVRTQNLIPVLWMFGLRVIYNVMIVRQIRMSGCISWKINILQNMYRRVIMKVWVMNTDHNAHTSPPTHSRPCVLSRIGGKFQKSAA